MRNILFLLTIFTIFSSSSIFALDYADEGSKEDQKVWYKNPKREVSVILTDEGYFPENIVVFKNEKVNFFITSTSEEMGCFIVDKHQVFVGAKKGKITKAEATFSNVGKYKVYCPTSKHAGQITVLEKKSEKPKREVASSKVSREWMPKEY